MKKRAKQVLVLALALSMLAGLSVGCKKDDDSSQADSGNASNQSTEQSSQADSTPDNGEIVTIQFYGGGANPSSTYYEWQQEYFEENLGLRVETIVSDKEKLQPMLAAGNLPDLGKYAVDGDPTQAIEGGHVMDLTDYEDQILYGEASPVRPVFQGLQERGHRKTVRHHHPDRNLQCLPDGCGLLRGEYPVGHL